MKRTITILALTVAVLTANAQSVTYNHDAAKQNQITVMETGGGVLTPDFYYWLLHNGYKKTAAAKNKLGFRTAAGLALYKQVDDAAQIDSALTKRAEVEALNMADRQIDLAWLAESSKINEALARFRGNIDRVLLVGGRPQDKERWEEYYNAYNCAVKATKDAFMPNAQRKKEYLRIYEDVRAQNETLVRYLVRLHNQSLTDELLTATYNRNTNVGSIAREAKSRWTEARLSARGSGGNSGGSGDETVNR